MAALPFVILDVFTGARFQGNPLAIVQGGEDLSDAQMQAIAREFNLSETVFLLPAENPAHTARVRIFTPAYEMPFAGHPTIGTAIFLAEERFGRSADQTVLVVLEENVGPVRCAVALSSSRTSFCEFDAPKVAAETGPAATDEIVAAALGLEVSDIGFDRHMPTMYSAGTPYAFVPVSSLEALARARIGAQFEAAAGDAGKVYVYARLPEDSPHAFRARMFAPDAGVPEDPATGSAAAAFAGVLARFEGLQDGYHQFPVEQGVEMGRPSLIAVEIEMAGGLLALARIGGEAVRVSRGEIEV
jgi:trans-2,3-dihydro-3-hydroxyanthranilate isomerase